MEKQYYFERNLLALSAANPVLCGLLSAAETTLNRYRFVDGKDGVRIPAWVDSGGAAHTLHSLISPQREAEKLTAALNHEGCLLLFGLGGGYLAEAALGRADVQRVIVIDYDINAVAELLCSKDYIILLSDPRFTLLVDPSPEFIEQYITGNYHPCVHGGIRLMPLRARCDFDREHFAPAAAAVRRAIDSVSTDYSAQAFLGKRWFANIIRNIFTAQTQFGVMPPITQAAVCAAGPSLDQQLPLLKENRASRFVIATDTSLGSLLPAGIKPDAVISIDCQHISYLHFLNNELEDAVLFLDLASPPVLAGRAKKSFFFSSGHPLMRYICGFYRDFPAIDASGANVTYAGISLAEKLGAKTIEVYGADFSYPEGMTYAKGAYFYPYLRGRANRFSPASSQLADFLFKIPSLVKIEKENSFYYETRALAMYRGKLEQKINSSPALILPAAGRGAPLCIARKQSAHAEDTFAGGRTIQLFSSGKTLQSAENFLADYKEKIAALPLPASHIEPYIHTLPVVERMIWTSLLPAAAAVKNREHIVDNAALIARVKAYCITEIEAVLNGQNPAGFIDNAGDFI